MSDEKRLAARAAKVAEARETILGVLEPGDTVWTSLEHVSQSGMTRVIQLHIFRPAKNESGRNPRHYVLGYPAAKLLDMTYDEKRNGVKIGGAGMDMGFALVYNLAAVLFDDGYALRHEWL